MRSVSQRPLLAGFCPLRLSPMGLCRPHSGIAPLLRLRPPSQAVHLVLGAFRRLVGGRGIGFGQAFDMGQVDVEIRCVEGLEFRVHAQGLLQAGVFGRVFDGQ